MRSSLRGRGRRCGRTDRRRDNSPQFINWSSSFKAASRALLALDAGKFRPSTPSPSAGAGQPAPLGRILGHLYPGRSTTRCNRLGMIAADRATGGAAVGPEGVSETEARPLEEIKPSARPPFCSPCFLRLDTHSPRLPSSSYPFLPSLQSVSSQRLSTPWSAAALIALRRAPPAPKMSPSVAPAPQLEERKTRIFVVGLGSQ